MLRTGLELSDGHPWLFEVFSSRFGKRRTALMCKSEPHLPRRIRPPRMLLGYLLNISTLLVIKNISWITCAAVW